MIIGICKGCDGFVRTLSPVTHKNGGVYHPHCYDRTKEGERSNDSLSDVPSSDNGGASQGNDSR